MAGSRSTPEMCERPELAGYLRCRPEQRSFRFVDIERQVIARYRSYRACLHRISLTGGSRPQAVTRSVGLERLLRTKPDMAAFYLSMEFWSNLFLGRWLNGLSRCWRRNSDDYDGLNWECPRGTEALGAGGKRRSIATKLAPVRVGHQSYKLPTCFSEPTGKLSFFRPVAPLSPDRSRF
jgi:hypothetical protein